MEFVVIALTALAASGLTLFSGFGLGTLLMPVVAIGVTALVHFANNLFKLGLLGLRADRNVLARFGIPAGGCGSGRRSSLRSACSSWSSC